MLCRICRQGHSVNGPFLQCTDCKSWYHSYCHRSVRANQKDWICQPCCAQSSNRAAEHDTDLVSAATAASSGLLAGPNSTCDSPDIVEDIPDAARRQLPRAQYICSFPACQNIVASAVALCQEHQQKVHTYQLGKKTQLERSTKADSTTITSSSNPCQTVQSVSPQRNMSSRPNMGLGKVDGGVPTFVRRKTVQTTGPDPFWNKTSTLPNSFSPRGPPTTPPPLLKNPKSPLRQQNEFSKEIGSPRLEPPYKKPKLNQMAIDSRQPVQSSSRASLAAVPRNKPQATGPAVSSSGLGGELNYGGVNRQPMMGYSLKPSGFLEPRRKSEQGLTLHPNIAAYSHSQYRPPPQPSFEKRASGHVPVSTFRDTNPKDSRVRAGRLWNTSKAGDTAEPPEVLKMAVTSHSHISESGLDNDKRFTSNTPRPYLGLSKRENPIPYNPGTKAQNMAVLGSRSTEMASQIQLTRKSGIKGHLHDFQETESQILPGRPITLSAHEYPDSPDGSDDEFPDIMSLLSQSVDKRSSLSNLKNGSYTEKGKAMATSPLPVHIETKFKNDKQTLFENVDLLRGPLAGEQRKMAKKIVDEEQFDAVIYSNPGAGPRPPGIRIPPLQSRVPSTDAQPDQPLYMHFDPRVHWNQPKPEAWYQAKMEEISKRPRRKENFGKAAHRWHKENITKTPVQVRQDFVESLPWSIRNDPKWFRARMRLEGYDVEVRDSVNAPDIDVVEEEHGDGGDNDEDDDVIVRTVVRKSRGRPGRKPRKDTKAY